MFGVDVFGEMATNLMFCFASLFCILFYLEKEYNVFATFLSFKNIKEKSDCLENISLSKKMQKGYSIAKLIDYEYTINRYK